MAVDSAIAALLHLDGSNATISSAGAGGASAASTAKLTARDSAGTEVHYFVKIASGPEAAQMFKSEHESVNALSSTVPGLAPRSFGTGRLVAQDSESFLVTEYLDMTGHRSGRSERASLASKLARLHTVPAPIPQDHMTPQFGFPVSTCCGSTAQKNDYCSSWAKFYSNNRLRFIAECSQKSNGSDKELFDLVERTCREVVPRLIGDDHLNNGHGVIPVVVHGDLWSGNAGFGRLPGMSEPEDVVYDPSACYAHSEYELGIMNMFGGFSKSFFDEYHKLCPKTEPVDEYDDRVKLYELYHHLNHHAMFGGYRGGAVSSMKSLLKKYGSKVQGEL